MTSQKQLLPASKPSTSSDNQDEEELPFFKAVSELRQKQWYWGNLSVKRSERLLKDKPPGTFLVRDSRSDNYFFSFSYQTSAGIFHSHVSLHRGYYCLGGPNSFIQSKSLVKLVEETIKSSKEQSRYHILMHPNPETVNQRFSDVHILFPLNRCSLLPSLKHLCRVAIRHSLKSEQDLNRLPLPSILHKYLSSPRYLSPI